MSLIKYEVFQKIVELGSLTRAAEALGLTQSAVSHAISSLEDEFGFVLLIRNRTGVRLTLNGERVLKHIRSLLNCDEQLKQEIAAIKGVEAGTIRIGTFSSVSINWLPGIIRSFRQEHPLIEVKLINGDYDEIEDWLKNGEIDFGFMSLPALDSFEVIPLWMDRMVCIVPKQHPLSGSKRISYAQIEQESFIMPTKGCDQDVRRVLSKLPHQPRVQFEAGDDYAIIAMVENGLGISIISEMILSSRGHQVSMLELEAPSSRSLGIVIPSMKHASPATSKFIERTKLWVDHWRLPGEEFPQGELHP
ncbi:LysR family transcriptional regulator [Paenibacillus durus]|uniref:LysR family transcriptional regulator n=1 Tax=Paenibacillus durus ATCC 35681 TaxID=1333534 RepID=A0A0F7FDU9_PAEDU|nr:LysR family transcriptional regulator [Paenibacillus durus]AKG37067.1 LysR family transcriptional regulator [Paenibacillus durus ATCC 35681]